MVNISWEQLETRSYWFVLVISFLAVAVWETRRPRLALNFPPERRWSRHGVLMLLYSVIWMAIYRSGPVVIALRVSGSRFGLLNSPVLPYTARFALTILLLDFVRYAAHWTEHHVPLLWRWHQLHHSDPDFDVSTGFRAHPLEVVYTQGAILAAVAVLAPPVAAVLVFELLICVDSCIGHANVTLPAWLDKPLRAVVVTPDMHRIHHSVDAREQCRNLGDIFSWWDRLLGTYLAHPAAGDNHIVVGLAGVEKSRTMNLSFMLSAPFLSRPASAVDQPPTFP
jgi:sterol desaturase/sphingolipid hydroxylase (fatty acid hydroxylase superfamily)